MVAQTSKRANRALLVKKPILADLADRPAQDDGHIYGPLASRMFDEKAAPAACDRSQWDDERDDCRLSRDLNSGSTSAALSYVFQPTLLWPIMIWIFMANVVQHRLPALLPLIVCRSETILGSKYKAL